MATHFTPLFERILDSSINEEPPFVRWLFVTLLVLQDPDGVVRGYNAYKLHRRANLSLEEVEKGLKTLKGPDKRNPNQEHQGRRIKEVEDGWKILNASFYQEEMRKIYRRTYNARKQREYRGKSAVSRQWPVEGNGDPPSLST